MLFVEIPYSGKITDLLEIIPVSSQAHLHVYEHAKTIPV